MKARRLTPRSSQLCHWVGGWPWASVYPSVKWKDGLNNLINACGPDQWCEGLKCTFPHSTLQIWKVGFKTWPFVEKNFFFFFACFHEPPTECKPVHLIPLEALPLKANEFGIMFVLIRLCKSTNSRQASLVAQLVRNPPAMQETRVWFLGREKSPGEGIGYPLQYSRASLVAQMVKNPPAMWKTWVRPLGWEDPLEEGTATHSSILAWRIPWTEEPSGPQSVGSRDWARLSTPIPGETDPHMRVPWLVGTPENGPKTSHHLP